MERNVDTDEMNFFSSLRSRIDLAIFVVPSMKVEFNKYLPSTKILMDNGRI